MHAPAILHRCLEPLLVPIDRARLAALFAAVTVCVQRPGLTLTDTARRLPGSAAFCHKPERTDRLVGNTHLQREAGLAYEALCRLLLAGLTEAVIVVDWSDLKADQSLHLLRASLPVGGQALTLYEEVHPQAKLNSRQVHIRFLRRLAPALCKQPPGVLTTLSRAAAAQAGGLPSARPRSLGGGHEHQPTGGRSSQPALRRAGSSGVICGDTSGPDVTVYPPPPS